MNDKTNAKPEESGIVMKATNSINIIPFDPNNSMNVNQINPSHSATLNLKTNSGNGNQWQPRHFRPNNFQPNSPPRQNNNYQTPPPRQAFRPFSNANTHFQDKLPPSPCWLCTKQGIANAYHWVQTCPFGFSAGQLPSPNPAPPNFDAPKEENQQ
ncbi:hypothetical protein AVEN_221782-1 [Araneus ventricosus]|uniref:Uncharacterized protein n=1 Tax=Araneus ventricosus TaxID=182803 RepID=A0A4Y2R0S7_ARAVE|nr:hypothetical protein AVEN_221782-1 [Araneus ventricosus]